MSRTTLMTANHSSALSRILGSNPRKRAPSPTRREGSPRERAALRITFAGAALRAGFVTAALIVACPAIAQSQPVGDRVEVNGMQMYYEVSGEGDPLIVLHGSYMNIPMMGEIIPKLAETNKVYALELQGHGRTTDIDRPITYPNLADDVAAFMDAVGPREGGRVRLLDGRGHGPAARDPPSGKGGPADLRVGRLRLRGMAAGVSRIHPADDGGDVPGDAAHARRPARSRRSRTAFRRSSKS